MEIKDYSWKNNFSKHKNIALLPNSIRSIIVGKPGIGKTNLLLNLLLQPEWIDYDHLYIFGKSLHQPEYKILKMGLEEGLTKDEITCFFDSQDYIKNVNVSPCQIIKQISNRSGKGNIMVEFFENADSVPDPKDLNEQHKNVLVFDDLMLGKQNICEAYYTRGRHNNTNCFYISQNYFRLPRQTIRECSNLIILFPQDYRNLNHIYNDHCTDIDKKEFKQFCRKCWETPHNFVTIDLTSTKYNGKYRSGFSKFYIPQSFIEC